METVVKGGTLVTATREFAADIRIVDGRIAEIGPNLAGAAVVDASGCIVLPGGIDPHTHIEMPRGGGRYNADDWFTGSRAAALGGTTTVIDMATQEKGGSLAETLADWRQRGEARSCIDFSVHLGLSDPQPHVLDEIPAMVAAGVPSFKAYMAYKGRVQIGDGEIYEIMRRLAPLGGRLCLHCENGDVIYALQQAALRQGRRGPEQHALTRPAVLEAEAVGRAIALCELTGCPLYIVHVSAGESLAPIRRAREAGLPVRAETCTHYLALAEHPEVLSPPIRTEFDQASLWAALADGTLDLVASDHCPFTQAGKEAAPDFTQIPNGGPGVEERLTVLYTLNRLSLPRLVEVFATNAARIFGLYPQKGAIAEGSDADLVVYDPWGERTLGPGASGAGYSMYEGMMVHGRVRHVLRRGELLVKDGEFVGRPGTGRFLTRRPA